MICVCAEQSWNLGYNKEIWLRGKITGFFDEETGNGLIFFAGERNFYLTIYSIITDGGNDANGEINPVEQIPSLLMLPLRNLLDGIK